MAEYSADYLERLQRAIDDFAKAFERWMGTQVESDHASARGLFPTVWAKDDADPQAVRVLELEVAEAAGRAARAVAVTGSYIMVAGAGAIDPIANWALMSAPKALVAPADIRLSAANVRGRLDAMLDEARAASSIDLPAFAPAQLHSVIWGGGRRPLDLTSVQSRRPRSRRSSHDRLEGPARARRCQRHRVLATDPIAR